MSRFLLGWDALCVFLLAGQLGGANARWQELKTEFTAQCSEGSLAWNAELIVLTGLIFFHVCLWRMFGEELAVLGVAELKLAKANLAKAERQLRRQQSATSAVSSAKKTREDREPAAGTGEKSEGA